MSAPTLPIIGIDTGGTFTDFVLHDGVRVRTHKEWSTPDAPERAILAGLRALGVLAEDARIVHGSTVATNAVLEGKGVRTALVITGKGDSPFARHTLHGKAHFHTEERAGRLRRLVPDWLHESQFRALVSGFQPAHPKHGGGGAYYVRLRRIREHP